MTQDELAEQFDVSRKHLRAVAARMLGSVDEADDAVQEAWLRASRHDVSTVANPPGWLTTIVGRVCLDMLRARRRRPEDSTDAADLEVMVGRDVAPDPEGAAVATETVGLALLAVLDRLSPAERVAFMLHDLFAVPFDEIARVVERTPATAKKLASRARRRVHGAAVAPTAETARQRTVVQAFLTASRDGDLDALLAVLAPDVVRRADRAALRGDAAAEVRGARRVAVETLTNSGRARFGEVALVDGAVGIVVAPQGRLRYVLRLDVCGDRIGAIDILGDPDRLARVEIAVLP